jgi:serine/threonine-protein kinase RsbW
VAEQPGIQPAQSVNWRLCWQIQRDLPALWHNLRHLDGLLGKAGLPPCLVNRVIVVLEELLTNIVKYGGAHSAGGDIALTIDNDASGLILRISSEGEAFDPRGVTDKGAAASLADQKIGGLGLVLVNRLTDRLEYRHEAGWNHLAVHLAVHLDRETS